MTTEPTPSATTNVFKNVDFQELNVLVSKIEVKTGGLTSKIFIDEFQTVVDPFIASEIYTLKSTADHVQTVPIPDGRFSTESGVSFVPASTQVNFPSDSSVCGENVPCLTIPSSSCKDPKLASFDMRLCQLGQLTLSQDRCVVSLGGLNVRDSTKIFSDSAVSGSGVTTYGPGKDVLGSLKFSYPVSLAMFTATFPSSQRTDKGCDKYWDITSGSYLEGYTASSLDAKCVGTTTTTSPICRHPSFNIRNAIKNRQLQCVEQPLFQKNTKQDWTQLKAQYLEKIPRSVAYGASANNDELTLRERCPTSNCEGLVKTFYYSTGFISGSNSLMAIQYLSHLKSVTADRSDATVFKSWRTNGDLSMTQVEGTSRRYPCPSDYNIYNPALYSTNTLVTSPYFNTYWATSDSWSYYSSMISAATAATIKAGTIYAGQPQVCAGRTRWNSVDIDFDPSKTYSTFVNANRLYGRYIDNNYTVPTTFDFQTNSAGVAMAEYRATPLDLTRTDLGTQGLCFATDDTRPPSYFQHLLSVIPLTYGAIRYWGDRNDYGNTPAIDVAAGVKPVWSTSVSGGSASATNTIQLTMSSSLSLYDQYGSSTGTASALGNCASYMKTQNVGSDSNAVFYSEFGAAAAVKRGAFFNGAWSTQENIWPTNYDDTYVLGVAFSAESMFLYAVTPTRLFASRNPLDIAPQVAWSIVNSLSSTSIYEYRGVASAPRAEFQCTIVTMSASATASATSSRTVSATNSISATSTASTSSRPTASTRVSVTHSGTTSSTVSSTLSVSPSATFSSVPSASLVPTAYTYGNILVSRIQRLNPNNFPCYRVGLTDVPNSWVPYPGPGGAAGGSSAVGTIRSNQCLELSRVWIDEYSWQSVNTDALPSVYQTNLFSKKQSMHFPHRSASHPDAYRMVLPFDQSLNLGLGQLTQSQDRCSVSMAGFDLPYNFAGSTYHPTGPGTYDYSSYSFSTPWSSASIENLMDSVTNNKVSGWDPLQNAFKSSDTTASAKTTLSSLFADVTPFNVPSAVTNVPSTAAGYLTAVPTLNCAPKVVEVSSLLTSTCANSGTYYEPPTDATSSDGEKKTCASPFMSSGSTSSFFKTSQMGNRFYGVYFSARKSTLITGANVATTENLANVYGQTYAAECFANMARGYPISVARIGGLGWKDAPNTHYSEYYSHWMPTKMFWEPDTVTPGMISMYDAPVNSTSKDRESAALNIDTKQEGKYYVAFPKSSTYSIKDRVYYRSGEFLVKSWEQVPRAVAYTTVKNSVTSLHMNQVYFSTGLKSSSSTRMGGAVLGRCWYGMPGTASTYSGAQLTTQQNCSETFTVVDPGNTDGSNGLCYVGGATATDLRLLQVRPRVNGAIYSWPESVSTSSVDLSYTPSLIKNNYLPTTATGEYAPESSFSAGAAYGPVVATQNTINSETNGGVVYCTAAVKAANGGVCPSSLGANLRSCAAFSPNTVSVTFGSPSSIFWAQKDASDGYAVQRSDFTTASGFFSAPTAIWGKGCAFMTNTLSTPGASCVGGSSVQMTEPQIDKSVVGLAYHSEPMDYKSHKSGFLYAVTTRALYGCFNPLAPYDPITQATLVLGVNGVVAEQMTPFWHKLMQIGVGAVQRPFPEYVSSSFSTNYEGYPTAENTTPDEMCVKLTCITGSATYSTCAAACLAATTEENIIRNATTSVAHNAAYSVVNGDPLTTATGYVRVNAITGVAIAPRTCAYDNSKFRE